MIPSGDIRAFDIQGGALFACTAAAGETLDLLAVASRAGLMYDGSSAGGITTRLMMMEFGVS